jgi:hypothetical protein
VRERVFAIERKRRRERGEGEREGKRDRESLWFLNTLP